MTLKEEFESLQNQCNEIEENIDLLCEKKRDCKIKMCSILSSIIVEDQLFKNTDWEAEITYLGLIKLRLLNHKEFIKQYQSVLDDYDICIKIGENILAYDSQHRELFLNVSSDTDLVKLSKDHMINISCSASFKNEYDKLNNRIKGEYDDLKNRMKAYDSLLKFSK